MVLPVMDDWPLPSRQKHQTTTPPSGGSSSSSTLPSDGAAQAQPAGSLSNSGSNIMGPPPARVTSAGPLSPHLQAQANATATPGMVRYV